MQTSEQLCTRKQNTMDEYPKIKNFPLKRRNWQSSNLVIELASCFLFPCWSRVSLVRFIRYRLETAKRVLLPKINHVKLNTEICYLLWCVHVSPLNYEFLSSSFAPPPFVLLPIQTDLTQSFPPFLSIGKSAQLVNFMWQLSFKEIMNFRKAIMGRFRLRPHKYYVIYWTWKACKEIGSDGGGKKTGVVS